MGMQVIMTGANEGQGIFHFLKVSEESHLMNRIQDFSTLFAPQVSKNNSFGGDALSIECMTPCQELHSFLKTLFPPKGVTRHFERSHGKTGCCCFNPVEMRVQQCMGERVLRVTRTVGASPECSKCRCLKMEAKMHLRESNKVQSVADLLRSCL